MIMTVAITILGLNVLLAGKQIERKELLMFVVKLAVITYFALGNAWQSAFFNGVFNTGMVIADIVMKPDEGTLVADDMNLQETSLVRPLTSAEQQQQAAIESKLDGCQFPKFNYNDSSDNRIKNFAYPYGKEYLKIWDMFDCKIAAALGFGPGVSVPNIAWMILGGFFTGGAGIVFFVGSFIFAFYLIALVIRALHIFLLSAISIILLVYVSPLTITSALFKKTNSIYQKWQAQMVGLILQPVILFAYLGILLTVFNKTMIGDVTFKGDGRNTPKQIVCQGEVQNTSMYCIFQIGEIKSYNGFEPLGLGIPMLTNMNATKINSIIKAAFLMFIFTKILDQIPSIATALVGGAKLASNSVGAGAMARKSFEALHAVQKRALRGIKKHAPAAAKRAAGAAKSVGQSIGDRGTAVEKSDPNKGAPKAAPDDVIRDEDGKGGKP
jgi:type IV secretory pathway VirB6-like protein